MMQARFSVLDWDGAWVAEETLAADPARAARLLADPPRVEGGIVIEDPDSGARADVGDTLGPLIGGLCLSGLDRLETEGRADIRFLDRQGSLAITLKAEVVRFDGTEGAAVSFPAGAYLDTMRACGARYRALQDAIGALEPGPGDRDGEEPAAPDQDGERRDDGGGLAHRVSDVPER